MSLYLNPRQFQNDEKGRSAPYATLDFYDTATFDRKNTYSDIGLTSPLPNPVVADAAGRFPKIYLAVDSAYRVVYSERQYPREDAPLTPVWTEDDIWASLAANSSIQAFDSIADLPAVTVGKRISTAGYYSGTTVGGIADGIGVASARHDGVIYFDPDRSSEIGTAAYYVDSGVDVPCWKKIDSNKVNLRTISDFFGFDGSWDNESAFLISWHPGLNAGGGAFAWDSDGDKADHNGGTIIDPDIQLTDFTAASVATYLSATGSGTGVWRRTGDGLPESVWNLHDFGIRSSDTDDQTAPMKSIAENVPDYTLIVFGGDLVLDYDGTTDVDASSAGVVYFKNKVGLKFEGNNVQLTFPTPQAGMQGFFYFWNCQRIDLSDFNYAGTTEQWSDPSSRTPALCFVEGDSDTFNLDNCYVEKALGLCISVLQNQSGTNYSPSYINISESCKAINCTYGVNYRLSGSGSTIRGVFEGVHRAVFLYGSSTAKVCDSIVLDYTTAECNNNSLRLGLGVTNLSGSVRIKDSKIFPTGTTAARNKIEQKDTVGSGDTVGIDLSIYCDQPIEKFDFFGYEDGTERKNLRIQGYFRFTGTAEYASAQIGLAGSVQQASNIDWLADVLDHGTGSATSAVYFTDVDNLTLAGKFAAPSSTYGIEARRCNSIYCKAPYVMSDTTAGLRLNAVDYVAGEVFLNVASSRTVTTNDTLTDIVNASLSV